MSPPQKSYFLHSCIFHILLFLILVTSYYFSSPPFVLENSEHKNIISAVILGDSPKSHILPEKKIEPTPIVKKEIVKPKPSTATDTVALKLAEKNKQEAIAKNLLNDIQKQHQTKKIKQQALQSQFAKTLQEEAEKSLRQQLLDEEIRLQAKEKKLSQGIINKYKALILQAISEQWLVPDSVNKSLSCELMIRLKENGEVLEVKLMKSSGDSALDSSARAAVMKASPLPVPKEAKEFDAFREFVLKVKPENIVRRDG